jgi:predicted secreted protein
MWEDPVLSVAVYIILWWMAFFMMLPIGVRNLDEAGDPGGKGQERGAPSAPNLRQKAVWAAGLAAIAWLAIAITLYVVYYSK